jgi:dTMP kinase
MSTTERRGLFITFEGLDGSGKTTQMRLLAEALRAEGREVIVTVEPGGTEIGGAIRRILLDPANHRMGATAEMLLYFAARAQNVDEILEPALARGAIVLSDRWTDSTLAYQGFGRELGTDVVEALDRIACRGRKPDLTLCLDVDVETGLQRARSRNRDQSEEDQSRMDEQSEAFYRRVKKGYDWLAANEPRRFRVVNGRGAVEEVAARVRAVFEEFRSGDV